MQYQDELESGQRALKSGWNISQQVEHYRRKLLRKVCLPFIIINHIIVCDAINVSYFTLCS